MAAGSVAIDAGAAPNNAGSTRNGGIDPVAFFAKAGEEATAGADAGAADVADAGVGMGVTVANGGDDEAPDVATGAGAAGFAAVAATFAAGAVGAMSCGDATGTGAAVAEGAATVVAVFSATIAGVAGVAFTTGEEVTGVASGVDEVEAVVGAAVGTGATGVTVTASLVVTADSLPGDGEGTDGAGGADFDEDCAASGGTTLIPSKAGSTRNGVSDSARAFNPIEASIDVSRPRRTKPSL